MKLNQRLSNLLLLIQIAKIYGDYGDLFGNWNSWSPCPAKCMAVFRTRERYCIATECFFEMYEEEKEACRIPTCVKPPSSLDTLDGCIEKKGRTIGLKLEYRDIPESQKTLSLDFEMEFPIIYVVIKVTRGFQGIKLRYTQPDRPDVWYTYLNKPLIKGEHVFLRAANTYRHDVNITIGFFTVRKLEISLLQSSLVSSMEEKTWAALLWGCKRERFYMEFVNEKSIYDDHIVWLSEPSKAVVANFSCRTNATRFYAEGMRIRNRITSKEVSFDSTKPLHVKVLQKTTDIYRGWNVISLNLNYSNAEALVGDFNKVEFYGTAHYYAVFECHGKMEFIGGKEYGMSRSDHIEVRFSADINECLVFGDCSPHAQCINTIGSFYCKCGPGYFGNGFSCYSREDWIANKRGVYTTSELEFIEFYDRALFYAKITEQLYACGRYKASPKYGCLVSNDSGETWETTHPRLDLVLGQSNSTDVLYGYSTQDSAYIMLLKKKWYSISQLAYYSARNKPDYQHMKVIVPITSNFDERRLEELYPLQSGQINVLGTLLAVTQVGISKCTKIDATSVSWSSIFDWSYLPLN